LVLILLVGEIFTRKLLSLLTADPIFTSSLFEADSSQYDPMYDKENISLSSWSEFSINILF